MFFSGDAYVGAGVGADDGFRDDSDEGDLVSQAVFSPLPTEYEYEDNDSACIAEHDQHTNALGSKPHWHDNILGTKPKPLQDMAYERGYENAGLVCERVPHIPTRKHQIVLL